MNLSSETIEILKNFAGINPNLVVNANEPLTTLSQAKDIFARATLTDKFDQTFGIYDLNKFIEVLGLIGDPDLQFNEGYVTLKNGRSSASYRFSDPSILTAPKAGINMPECEVSVTITADILSQVRKAAGVLGHSVVSLKGEGGKVSLAVSDKRNSTSNTFDIVLDESNACTSNFDLQFLIANISKVLSGDYDVKVSSKRISSWKHQARDVEYYIALQETSTFE